MTITYELPTAIRSESDRNGAFVLNLRRMARLLDADICATGRRYPPPGKTLGPFFLPQGPMDGRSGSWTRIGLYAGVDGALRVLSAKDTRLLLQQDLRIACKQRVATL